MKSNDETKRFSWHVRSSYCTLETNDSNLDFGATWGLAIAFFSVFLVAFDWSLVMSGFSMYRG